MDFSDGEPIHGDLCRSPDRAQSWSLVVLDQRSSPRFAADLNGALIFADADALKTFACKIVDLSYGGARVAANKTIIAALPENIILFEGLQGNFYECEIRWRRLEEVGLQFMDVVTRRRRKGLIAQLSQQSSQTEDATATKRRPPLLAAGAIHGRSQLENPWP